MSEHFGQVSNIFFNQTNKIEIVTMDDLTIIDRIKNSSNTCDNILFIILAREWENVRVDRLK